MSDELRHLLDRFHEVLVEEIRAQRPEYLHDPFTVAEIYQNLVPYRTHRDRIGLEMNADYEDVLLRLLAGEGDYLVLDSEPALRDLREELESPNPNTGLYREFAALDVRLNPGRIPHDVPLPGAERRAAAAEEPPVPELRFGFAEPDEPVERDESAEPASSAPAVGPRATDEMTGAAARHETGAPPETVEVGALAPGGDGEVRACLWCRAELPARENLNFCPFCGTDIHLVPCPSCGEELEPGWRFCAACGAEVVG